VVLVYITCVVFFNMKTEILADSVDTALLVKKLLLFTTDCWIFQPLY